MEDKRHPLIEEALYKQVNSLAKQKLIFCVTNEAHDGEENISVIVCLENLIEWLKDSLL